MVTGGMASKGSTESTAVMEALTTIAVNGDPATYEEAISNAYREQWLWQCREHGSHGSTDQIAVNRDPVT